MIIWERDAAYDYDRLGTLRRVTIGEDSVQGIDYTYTLLGELKAINHPSLDPANDAGQDGTGTGANRNVAKDAFALGLSYHDGDFEKTVGSTESPFNTNNTSFLKHEGTSLWSGFIGATTLHLAEITVPSGSTLMRNGALMGERLKYDRIGRLRVVTTYENVGNTWTSDATSGWSSSYMYDQNSNLTRVKRSEALSATPGFYDDVTIAPKDLSGNNSNVIDVVTDAGTNAVAGFTDLRTQTTAQNEVDVTGRVTTESNSGLARTNTWTSTDALSTATAGTTEARYLYDAAGNVVRIIVDNAGTDSTIYRIPSGGIADVATYKRVGNGNVVPMEWTIIGNGLIGVSRDVEDPETGPTFHRRVGSYLYALADHLGSVRAVVGDVKIPASGGTFTADVMSVYDYEAYGVPRPGLSLDVRVYWRYGFQGMLKQSELLGSTTDVSDYLTPFRSYDARSGRWRSHDPIFQPWESTYLGMGGNPAMMVDPWGLKGTGLTYVRELGTPLKPQVTGIYGVPFSGSTPPAPASKPWISNPMINIAIPSKTEVSQPLIPWQDTNEPGKTIVSPNFSITFNVENMNVSIYRYIQERFRAEHGQRFNYETRSIEPDPDYPQPNIVYHVIEERARVWSIHHNIHVEKRIRTIPTPIVRNQSNDLMGGATSLAQQGQGWFHLVMILEYDAQIKLAKDALTVVTRAAREKHPGMSEYYRSDPLGQAILANYILTGELPTGKHWGDKDLTYLQKIGNDLRNSADRYLPSGRKGIHANGLD